MSVELPKWKDLKGYEKRSKRRLHNLLSELSPDIPEWSKLNPLVRGSKRKRYDLYATVLGLKHYRHLPRQLVRSTRQYWDYLVDNVDPGPPGPVDVVVKIYEQGSDRVYIPNAHVHLNNDITSYDGITDDDGKVTLVNVEPGEYKVDAEASGYEDLRGDYYYDVNTHRLLEIPMWKNHPLTFYVTDTDSKPIYLAKVVIDGKDRTTDNEGYAVFDELNDGVYSATISDELEYEIEELKDFSYNHRTQYLQNVTLVKRSEPGTLTATIKCVKADNGDPIPECTVRFDNPFGQIIGSTDANGEVLAERLDYTEYTFFAHNSNDIDYSRKTEITVNIKKNNQTYIIPFERE